MSTRTKARKNTFVKAVQKHNRKQAKAAATVVKNLRMAKLRPGAAGVYRALLNPRVQGFLGLEKKYFDTRRNAEVVATLAYGNWIYNPLAADIGYDSIATPETGVGPTHRLGKHITIKSIQIRGQFSIDGYTIASIPRVPEVFLALVLDTQTNGAQCGGGDIFTNPDGSLKTITHPLRNLLNAKRFRVLKESVFTFPVPDTWYTGAANVQAGTFVSFDWYLPCEIQVNFKDDSQGLIANVIDNSIHVVATCSTGAHSFGPPVYIDYNARVRFLG